ncbi:MAG: 2OG-Fe(II) oxygenase [Gammaproteobacteria bacterium]
MRQSVTPELRQWIVEQAQAGFAPEAVVEAMKASGWDEAVAIQALEATLRDHMEGLAAGSSVQPLPGVGAQLPDIRLAGSPREVDAGDRVVQVLVSVRHPRIVVLGNLLAHDECDQLIDLARPRMARSLTVQTRTGGQETSPDRTSNGMFFNRGEYPVVTVIEARIARLVDWPVTHGEGIQVLNYREGAEYKPHYDYFDPAEPGSPTVLQRGGQRVATLVMYLNEPEQGGGTTFPDIGLEVAPQKGSAVFFSYDRPHPSTRTLHGGAPVLAGEKWVATKWLRQREVT